VINNAGDLPMTFSFTSTRIGKFSLLLDGEEKWVVEKNIAGPVYFNG
jgi:hypothetical protein